MERATAERLMSGKNRRLEHSKHLLLQMNLIPAHTTGQTTSLLTCIKVCFHQQYYMLEIHTEVTVYTHIHRIMWISSHCELKG